jgi:GNAT superfamily N-acetyltransferase
VSVVLHRLTGAAIRDVLGDLARLRIEVFREWPYLYDGTYAYEADYIAAFSESAGSLVVAAEESGRIVGAATATHLGGHAEELAEPFRAKGFDTGHIYYFGESVLLPAWRGRGLGHAFFDAREDHARKAGGFTHATFCAVVRPADHPMKPESYRPLDGFWQKRGYAAVPGLVGSFSWKDIGADEETAKPMQYWMKAL